MKPSFKNRLSRINALIAKETLTLFRDKKSRFILIVPPLLQLFIFSFAATREVNNISIAISNHDTGKHSQELIQQISASTLFSKIHATRNITTIKNDLDTQKIMAALLIPQDFSHNIENGQQATIQLILDGRKSAGSQTVANYLTTLSNTFGSELTNRQGSPPAPILTIHRNWFNPNLQFPWFTLPSMVVMLAVLLVIIVTALSVSRERELGTLDQLLVSPLMPLEILMGKTIPALFIGMSEGLIVTLASITIFKVPLTSPFLYLLLALLVFILSVVGIGLFISSFARTQQQAILSAFLFLVPTIMLSGYASPVDNMPSWLQKLSVFNPLVYYFKAIKGLFLKDMPFHLLWNNLWPPFLIGMFALFIAGWMFTRKEK